MASAGMLNHAHKLTRQLPHETKDQAIMNERILKALNDLKSAMDSVKKYMAAQEQAEHTEVHIAKWFEKKNLEHAQQNTTA
jgi:hypothetical protein